MFIASVTYPIPVLERTGELIAHTRYFLVQANNREDALAIIKAELPEKDQVIEGRILNDPLWMGKYFSVFLVNAGDRFGFIDVEKYLGETTGRVTHL